MRCCVLFKTFTVYSLFLCYVLFFPLIFVVRFLQPSYFFLSYIFFFILNLRLYIDYHVWHCTSIVLCMYSKQIGIEQAIETSCNFLSKHINEPCFCNTQNNVQRDINRSTRFMYMMHTHNWKEENREKRREEKRQQRRKTTHNKNNTQQRIEQFILLYYARRYSKDLKIEKCLPLIQGVSHLKTIDRLSMIA